MSFLKAVCSGWLGLVDDLRTISKEFFNSHGSFSIIFKLAS